MIQTMMAMGIFLDAHAMSDRSVDYYFKGGGNRSIGNYINDIGECQESGRDQGHTQMGLGYLGCACEMAWKQGVDLYGALDNRLAAGFEHTAKYNLGNEVPSKPCRSFKGTYFYRSISPDGRGRFSPIYDRTVYHFHHRLKMDMPYSMESSPVRHPDNASAWVPPGPQSSKRTRRESRFPSWTSRLDLDHMTRRH